MSLPKIKLEHIFLLIIFATLLHTGVSNLWDHKLDHDYPYSYLAGDAFQHWVRTDGIKQTESYRVRVPFQSYGYDDVIGDYPPIIFHLAIIFSDLSGLETYDTILLIVFLAAISAAFLVYLIIKDYNKHIAIISLPFSLLIFSGAAYTGFTWGHWPSLLAQFFLIGIVWAMKNIDLKKSYLLIAIFFAATFLTHSSEAILGFLFIIFFLLITLYEKNKFKDRLKTSIFAGIISFIIIAYYLFIFQNTWAKGQSYSFSVVKAAGGSPTVQMAMFSIFAIIILAGLIIAFILLFQKKSHIATTAAIFFMIMGYTNYIGFHSRAFQIRYLWPIYLSIFIGIPLYYGLKAISKKWNIHYSYVISILLLLLLLNTFGVASSLSLPHYEKFSSPGMMDPFHWDAYQWIDQNTPEDAKVLFLYGDQFGQTNYILSVKRVPYKIDENDFLTTLQTNPEQRDYLINIYGDNVNWYPYWGGFLKVNYHLKETDEFRHGQRFDICDFDYYIYDKVSRDERIPPFNKLITDKFRVSGMEDVFTNQVVGVMKNNNRGENCVG